MSRQRMRIGRAAWAAAAAVLVASGGHALGGGEPLDASSLPVVLVVSVLAAVGITRVRWTVPRMSVALLGTQALVHAALWITTAPTSAHPRLAAYVPDGDAAAHAHASSLTPRMLGAHVLAAIVTAAALVVVDSLVVLVRAFAARVSLLRDLPVLVPAVTRSVAPRRRLVVPSLVPLDALRGNAPPLVTGLG